MAKNAVPDITFPGYSSPNYTPVPDELFDDQLPFLSGAELKVLLYIIRRTFGFKKDADNISLQQLMSGITGKDGVQLDRGTGLSKKTLLETIKSLIEKNLIVTQRRRSKERGDEPTTYHLNFRDGGSENTSSPRGVKSIPGGGEKTTPGPSDKNYTTQETVLQETELQSRISRSTVSKEIKHNRTRSQGFTSIATLLPQSELPASPPGTTQQEPPWKWEEHGELKAAVTDISTRFGDRKNLPANLSQFRHLLEACHEPESRFVAELYEEYANVKDVTGIKNRMAYFCVCFRRRKGIGERDAAPRPPQRALGEGG
jgi:hypothetical protein